MAWHAVRTDVCAAAGAVRVRYPAAWVLGALISGVLVLSACSSTATAPMTSPAASSTPAIAAPTGPEAAPEPEAASAPAATRTPTAGPVEAEAPTLAELYEANRDEILAVGARKGPAAALRMLDRRIRRTPALAGVCHPIAHDLGHQAVELGGGGIDGAQAALTDRDDVCGGGYTHGAIELALGKSTDPERDLLRVCAPANDGSCFHGVGHGLMFATGMHVRRSLDLCDGSPTRTLAARCGEGVFMQLFSADLSAGHTSDDDAPDVARDPDAASATCQRVRDAYAPNCWFYAPTVWLAAHPDDFAGALAWCRAEATGDGRQLCARGVGSRSVKYHPDDVTIGARICASAPRLADSCFQGMGSYWSVHHRGRKPPIGVCRHIQGADLADRCRAATFS
jgi:hypothetical protein